MATKEKRRGSTNESGANGDRDEGTSVQSDQDRFADNLPDDGATAPEAKYEDHVLEERDAENDEPDVLLDVPVLKVEEINLEVEDLRARVSLQAEVLDLLKLNVGADVTLGRVGLEIKGVEAQALLKVRLDNVARILDRVLTTIDRNPQILENITKAVGSAVEDVGEGAGEAVEEIGGGARQAVGELGRGAGSAVEDVGKGAGSAVEDVGEGAGSAVEDVGEGAGSAVEDVGESAGEAVEEAGETAKSAGAGAGRAAGETGKAAKGAGKAAGETAGGATKAAGKTTSKASRAVGETASKASKATGKSAGGASKTTGKSGKPAGNGSSKSKSSQRSAKRRRASS